MKALWTGSDVIYATKYPRESKRSKWVYMFFYKIFVRIMDFFVEEHYVVSEHLKSELPKLRKKVSVLVDPPKYTRRYRRRKHEGFNVLYYRARGNNQKFTDWIYGYDIYLVIKEMYEDLNFIEVDGTQDMAEIYPITDFYLRPNRHDGKPRMVIECEISKIPYYHSISNPDIYEITKTIDKARTDTRI